MQKLFVLMFGVAFATLAHAAGDPVAGKSLFDRRCASCHQVGPSARAAFGPQLNGVIGRTAGATADYAYSPAMKASRVKWTEDTLRAFLRSPDDVVPGTRMRFWGMRSERDVANLLAYLRTTR